MSLHLITGHAGTEHVTSANAGMFNSLIFGADKYIFEVGQKFNAEIRSNNLIRVYDGEGLINGRHFDMVSGTYEDLEISNGAQALNRNDLIVARYEVNDDTGIESIRFVVIEGDPVSGEAVDPDYNEGSILDGNGIVDMPMYRISIKGLSVDSITPLFTIKKSVDGRVDELNNDLSQLRNLVEVTTVDRKELTIGTVYTATKSGYLFVLDSGAVAHLFIYNSADIAIGIPNGVSDTGAYNSVFVVKGMQYRLDSGRGFFLELN